LSTGEASMPAAVTLALVTDKGMQCCTRASAEQLCAQCPTQDTWVQKENLMAPCMHLVRKHSDVVGAAKRWEGAQGANSPYSAGAPDSMQALPAALAPHVSMAHSAI
jgi:hypothetical protein